jgi:hypothetical protein
MLGEEPEEREKLDAKSVRMRDVYRRMLATPGLSNREIDEMRQYVIRLAQVLCEHVWGKRFY